MSSQIEQPLIEFKSDLERLSQLLGLLGSFRDFGGIDPIPAAPAQDDPLAAFFFGAVTVRDGIRRHGSDLSVLSGSLLLYLAGRFEHFSRMTFQALCDAYAVKCSQYLQLPKKMRRNIHYYTAEVSLNFQKYGFDEVQAFAFMSSYVQTSSATSSPLVVNSECLSVTQNNMRPEVLSDLFKRIGVESLWLDLSKQSIIKVFFETDKDAEAERLAKAKLEELMTSRNGIAHPSGTPSFPDMDQIRVFLDFIAALSEALCLVAKVHATAFKPIAADAA